MIQFTDSSGTNKDNALQINNLIKTLESINYYNKDNTVNEEKIAALKNFLSISKHSFEVEINGITCKECNLFILLTTLNKAKLIQELISFLRNDNLINELLTQNSPELNLPAIGIAVILGFYETVKALSLETLSSFHKLEGKYYLSYENSGLSYILDSLNLQSENEENKIIINRNILRCIFFVLPYIDFETERNKKKQESIQHKLYTFFELLLEKFETNSEYDNRILPIFEIKKCEKCGLSLPYGFFGPLDILKDRNICFYKNKPIHYMINEEKNEENNNTILCSCGAEIKDSNYAKAAHILFSSKHNIVES